MSVYVLDACAVLAALRDEPGADRVREVLASGATVLLGAINVLEIVYDEWRTHGKTEAQRLLAGIEQWQLLLIRELSDDVLLAAASFKSRGRLSLADACALGLAQVHGGMVVTSDHHEFDPLEKARLARFHWIR
jgi:PIN domain nuclease of toxin-antitoxin system